MTLTEASPLTYAEIRTRVRFEVDDPDARATGQSIPEAQRRFTDAEVLRAVQDAFVTIETEASHQDRVFAMRNVDVAVTDQVVALPAEILGESIYLIEDIRNENLPFEVSTIDPAERTTLRTEAPVASLRVVVERSGSPSGSTGHPQWQLRLSPPFTESTTFRIWYIQAPTLPGADADAHTLALRWRTLVVLTASRNLLRRTDAFTLQQTEDLFAAQRQFKDFRIVKKPGRIRRARRALT